MSLYAERLEYGRTLNLFNSREEALASACHWTVPRRCNRVYVFLVRKAELDSSLRPLRCRNKGHVIGTVPPAGGKVPIARALAKPVRTWRPEAAG